MHELFPLFIALATDPTPEAEDVKAGWTAFAIFLLLCVAVGLLGWSLARQLRKTDRNRKAGVFGNVPESSEVSDQEKRDPDSPS